MGLFGKGVTWSASRSMGESQGESRPLLFNLQKKLVTPRGIQYLNPIVLMKKVTGIKQWRKKEIQENEEKRT
uniref:S2 protein n=1 Tax=Equine infectious anemia virus TaxID=11665 RepID=A0A6C0WVI0_9RETR|nr:S2 protein [Equine infectious anemia virus]